MRTIIVELPDDLATALEAMPEGERNHFAVSALRDRLAYQEDAYEETEEEKAEILAALMESKAQDEAGLTISLDEMKAAFVERETQVRAKLAAR
jgi:metal-responsive CopG/Arc/MetJ family transcriptional regulator